MEIKIERAATLKEKPDQNNLGFGNYFTDHMFMMDYTDGIGWHDARIVPYAPIPMEKWYQKISEPVVHIIWTAEIGYMYAAEIWGFILTPFTLSRMEPL